MKEDFSTVQQLIKGGRWRDNEDRKERESTKVMMKSKRKYKEWKRINVQQKDWKEAEIKS